MIATEAAAEGVNLQFCSLLINYDLPWNPQCIEQRIGRCHRYGQKHDVEEKLKTLRRVKDMEKKRNAMRLNLFKLQDEADERKEKLIEEIEGRLKQKIKQKDIFSIRWKIL